ncbi:FMN-dependent NADH-azoreductase [Candidatus Finniella inopinata]|uniref:FMN dependent NADH:quinone oxidoreductase n=1 Tax=Candidatus Finniella inopinata TaxID=1696036 RepID=A0A4Q7DGG0_9PROT|nr:NAD(P)H-dependent oxidoreductase [Candidatus Finniella inopinata]RZI45893.1 FMN-dependent NADH-azoreductase [Candidatus Finniella inopinata]
MVKLLRIDSSARTTNSHSRHLADIFQKDWLSTHPNGTVVVRNIIEQPIPHILNTTITGFYTPADQLTPDLKEAVKLSDELIAELKSADEILISAPIYNFSIPSALKAWIDHIVRMGETFSYDGKSFKGLLTGKKVYFCLAYGGEGYTGPIAAMDFLKPYLQTLFGFLGFESMEFFVVEGTSTSPEALSEKIKQTQEIMHKAMGI